MHQEPDLSVPLSKQAKRYLINRGEDWRIKQLEEAAENVRRSLEAADQADDDDGFNEADDYNDWKVQELKSELNGRRQIAKEKLPDDATEQQHAEVDRRFSTDGRKEDLVQRLEEDDRLTNA